MLVLPGVELHHVPAPPSVFIEGKDLPEAYKIIGRYRVAGETVTVNIRLFQGDRDVAKYEVKGEKGQLDQLAREIVRQTQTRLKGAP